MLTAPNEHNEGGKEKPKNNPVDPKIDQGLVSLESKFLLADLSGTVPASAVQQFSHTPGRPKPLGEYGADARKAGTETSYKPEARGERDYSGAINPLNNVQINGLPGDTQGNYEDIKEYQGIKTKMAKIMTQYPPPWAGMEGRDEGVVWATHYHISPEALAWYRETWDQLPNYMLRSAMVEHGSETELMDRFESVVKDFAEKMKNGNITTDLKLLEKHRGWDLTQKGPNPYLADTPALTRIIKPRHKRDIENLMMQVQNHYEGNLTFMQRLGWGIDRRKLDFAEKVKREMLRNDLLNTAIIDGRKHPYDLLAEYAKSLKEMYRDCYTDSNQKERQRLVDTDDEIQRPNESWWRQILLESAKAIHG